MERKYYRSFFLISFVLLLVSIASVAIKVSPASARVLQGGNLRITYSGDGPLWDSRNILPGYFNRSALVVENLSTALKRVGLRASNQLGSSELPKKLELKVYANGGLVYGSSDGVTNIRHISDLFVPDDQEVTLSEITGGGVATYDFDVTFEGSAGNSYKGLSTTFDLVIGGVAVPGLVSTTTANVLGASTEEPTSAGEVLGLAATGGGLPLLLLSLGFFSLGIFTRRKFRSSD